MNGFYEKLAKVYDKLMKEDFDYPKWFSYLERFFPKDTKHILELGCGSGLMTEELIKHRYHVAGVDLSEEMLLMAEQKTKNYANQVQYFCYDMALLPKIKEFDCVVSVCDVMNYCLSEETLYRTFSCAHENLRENGRFLFDMVTEKKLKDLLGNETYVLDEEDITYIWNNTIKEDIVREEITFFIKTEDTVKTEEEYERELYERFDELHEQKIFCTDRVTALLRKAGFQNVTVYSFMTLDPCKPEDIRVQFVAEK